MTMLNEEDLQTLQQEVQIKAIVAHHKLSGSFHDLDRARAAQIDDTARKTLGTLVGDLLGSYVVAGAGGHPEETTTNSPENVNWFAMQITLGLPAAEFARVESELREMVLLRNNLVHHFIDQHDLRSPDGCRGAQDALVTAYNRVDHHFGQLQEWAEDMKKIRQTMSELLQSEEFKDVFVNGTAPDGKVNWDASGIVRALQEAFGALAVDGWAPVAEAGKWITKRYPEQLPAKYGCLSWRQVVHNAPILELQYLEMDGQRTACYREKDRAATQH
jgi:hypothetical protein